ncbi:MAG TPA: NAD-dependent epimerase/dehydratase family protein [Polyangiaceae bacterium]|nr:NAD-dependent epimerase/dehydratase family protein [Polyangiaceae bacterium]
MTVLLTGATGHVGANLLRCLLERRERVRALVRPASDLAAVKGLDVELAEADVRDLPAVRAAMMGASCVYHCAARVQTVHGREQELFDVNVLGTRNVLKAAKEAGVSRVVVTGSLGAVGHPVGRPCTEEDPFNPFERHLPYEESKAWVEHECLRAVCSGLEVVIAVSTAVLGPHDYVPSRMGRVVRDFANGNLGAYIPGGFEFVSASDLAVGHVLCMEKGRPGQRYIFSTRFLSVDDLMGILERITGRRRPRRLPRGIMMGVAHVSTFVLSRVAPEQPQRFTPDAVRLLGMERRADISKARTELGFAPTSIDRAIEDAYAWFHAQGQIRPGGRRDHGRLPVKSHANGAREVEVAKKEWS